MSEITPEIEEKVGILVGKIPIGYVRQFASLTDQVEQTEEDYPLIFYEPNLIQEPFHNSTAIRRLFYGGNMTGKSRGGAKEAACHILGYDPSGTTTKRYPKPPTHGWVGASRMEQAINISKTEIEYLLPQGFCTHFNKENFTMLFKNGSKCTLKSYESPVEAWTGMPVDWIWLDEECPWILYKEAQSRVNRRSGPIWITVTPLYTNSRWMYTELVKKAPFVTYIDVFKAKLRDNVGRFSGNKFITEEQFQQQEADFKGAHDEKARLYGDFLSFEGRIFYEYNPIYQYVAAEPILEMLAKDRLTKYPQFEYALAVDAHENAPDVCTWAAFNRDLGLIYFIAEMRCENMHAGAFAERVLERSSDFGPIETQILDTGESDKDIATGTNIRNTMADYGLLTEKPMRNRAESRDRINEYSRYGGLFVLDTCPLLNEALDLALWDQYKGNRRFEDAPKEKPKTTPLTHHSDTARYLMMLMDNLKFTSKNVGKSGQYFPKNSKTGKPLLTKIF